MTSNENNYDLRIILFEITQKCNAACDHCGSRCDIDSKELLTKEEILDCLRDVKENIGTDMMINVSGGEPLMRQDLFEIMTEVSNMGFDWGMVTNGTLITDAVIEKMKASRLKTITVSIDGLRDTHEALRHLPGSFDKIIEGLKKLKAADFLDHIQVTFTSNKKNVYEFPELYEVLDGLGLDSIRTSFIDEIGRAEDNKDLILGRKEMNYIMDYVNKINESGRTPIVWGCPHYLGDKLTGRKFHCFAGIYAASILYNGDIFVCPNVPRRPELIQGNIKQDKFSKVWNEGFEFFRNRPSCIHKYCEGCEYIDDCRGDSAHTWDYDNDRPKFCYKKIFDLPERAYKKYLEKKYGNPKYTVIEGERRIPKIYIEPEAYEEMKRIFHIGKKHPQSMYEQQVGLVGFKTGDILVVRYVFEDYGAYRYKDNALFTKRIMDVARFETGVINKNFLESEDADCYMGGAKKYYFLGFAHSHPVQEELCYSVGDDVIHRRLAKKCKHYIGVLIYPEKELIGAYYGPDVVQTDLVIVER